MFNRIFSWTIALLAFTIPLFFLPLTFEFYFFNKTLLLYSGILLLLVLLSIKIIKEGQIKLTFSPFHWPIFLILISYLFSIIFASPNKVEALLGRGGLIISLTILYFVITNNIHLYSLFSILYSLIISASILALVAIYQYIGVSASLFNLPVWMQSKIWTPAGSSLALVTFLLPTFILSLVLAIKNKDSLIKTLLFLAAALQVIAIILTVSLILPALPVLPVGRQAGGPGEEFSLSLLPYQAGWQIATASFGQSPLFGVGPENFLSAFTRFRPINLNNLGSWSIRFFSSSNEYFHLLTTVGILGLLAFLLLILRFLKSSINQSSSVIRYPLYAIFLLQLFLPANLLLLFLEYLLLSLFVLELKNAGDKEISQTQIHLTFLKKSFWYILIPVFILVSSIYYLILRVWLADYYFRQSLLSAAENRGKDTYDLQIKAIQFNSYNERYRLAYSQTNLALANSIASKPDISDQDRQNISQLIQQAIQEAKTATALNKNKVINWENLANLYRNLINFAQGADQWTIACLINAIRLDPINPLLRLDLGGLYYSLGNYDDAIKHFQIATELKPDYPNAYYNLASAYREKGEIKKAVDNMEIILNLIEVDSGDYQKAKSELEELKKRLPEEEKIEEISQPETLKGPEPLPSPIVSPPIELPQEAQPEITPQTTFSPVPSPTSTPTL